MIPNRNVWLLFELFLADVLS